MMSDVPFGVFLSGGIDSTANVALMARLMEQPVRTFTVGFRDEPALQRTRRSASASPDEYGTDHHEVIIGQQELTRLSARPYLPSGRADRRSGLRPALLRVEAGARDRHNGRSGWRRLGRALLRLQRLRILPEFT